RYLLSFSRRRRHTRSKRDCSSDVCSSDLATCEAGSFVTFPASAGFFSGFLVIRKTLLQIHLPAAACKLSNLFQPSRPILAMVDLQTVPILAEILNDNDCLM